jgi:FixJ family two-component response regulator
MKREGSAEALLDGSIPCCASTSLHAHRGFEFQDAQNGLYLPSKRRSLGSAKVTVVVVDDDLRVLKALGDLLDPAGYDARLFSSGQEFLACPDVRNARCLISDIGMPGMNGIELLRRIKAQGMDLPCILLTDRDETETVLFCRTEGARFLLPKPIIGQELLAAVSLVINRLSSSQRIGFVDALRSAVSRARAFSDRPLVSRVAALFAGAKTPRNARSGPDSDLHTVA